VGAVVIYRVERLGDGPDSEGWRTAVVVGRSERPPTVGRRLVLTAPGLEFGSRVANTSKVVSVGAGEFETESGSRYRFEEAAAWTVEVAAVAGNYWSRIRGDTNDEAVRANLARRYGGAHGPLLDHVAWMLAELVKFDDRGKAIRWLCFVQGVLWSTGHLTIDEAREHNRGILLC
jgi:hypothetical protein